MHPLPKGSTFFEREFLLTDFPEKIPENIFLEVCKKVSYLCTPKEKREGVAENAGWKFQEKVLKNKFGSLEERFLPLQPRTKGREVLEAVVAG